MLARGKIILNIGSIRGQMQIEMSWSSWLNGLKGRESSIGVRISFQSKM